MTPASRAEKQRRLALFRELGRGIASSLRHLRLSRDKIQISAYDSVSVQNGRKAAAGQDFEIRDLFHYDIFGGGFAQDRLCQRVFALVLQRCRQFKQFFC